MEVLADRSGKQGKKRGAIRIFLGALLVLVLLLASGTAYLAIAYHGFAVDVSNDLRYGKWAELKVKYAFFYYYALYYEKLRINPETNMYDLEEASRAAHASKSATDFDRALLDFHSGRFEEAVREIKSDIASRGENEERLFWLALGYMRAAEAANCLDMGSPATQAPMPGHEMGIPHARGISPFSCSLPLTQFHQKKELSGLAAKTFEKLLDNYDAANPLYRWLLNFSYMTIDRFPDAVPVKYRIETPFIDSFYGKGHDATLARHPDLSMEDQAEAFGVNTFDAGKGVAVEDFNGDGWLDIVTGGTFSGTRYYENDHGLRFIDRTVESGLGKVTQAYMITAADYDNDGKMDLLISRPFQRFALMHNEGNGRFTDQTISSGLLKSEPDANTAVYTCVTTWADVNNDGKLDLFIAQFAQKMPYVGGLLGRNPMSSKLYINLGGGHFADRTDEFGLTDTVNDNVFIGATFADYDRDGFPDLFVSAPSRLRSVLLHNLGGKRFERTTLIDAREPGFTTSFIDINHDGFPDLFQGTMALAIPSTANGILGKNPHRYASKIFLQKNGVFENRSDYFDGDSPIGTMGASYGDINNDGCYDFYLGTGSPESWMVTPNLLFLGQSSKTTCTGRMENISSMFGAGTIQKGHAIVFADFNNDGLQDIYSSLGGMWPGDSWPNQLFVNKSTTGNSWLKIRLHGRQSNGFGVGAAIKVTASNPAGEEIVRTYDMDARTGFGSAPFLAHIGLMNANAVQSVQVRWPGSGKVKVYAAKLNALNTLDEDEGTLAASK